MIEITVYGYLNGVLDVPVFMEIPPNPPVSFVLIEKTSGSQENRINTATFAIQSYGASLYDAAMLNDVVKIAMLGDGEDNLGIIYQNEIFSCKLNSDYNFTDVSQKKYRYQAVFDIYY